MRHEFDRQDACDIQKKDQSADVYLQISRKFWAHECPDETIVVNDIEKKCRRSFERDAITRRTEVAKGPIPIPTQWRMGVTFLPLHRSGARLYRGARRYDFGLQNCGVPDGQGHSKVWRPPFQGKRRSWRRCDQGRRTFYGRCFAIDPGRELYI